MKVRHVYVALFCLLVCAALVLADTLTLKDGTVLEGKVIPQGDSYWIKLTTGETKIIPKIQVAEFRPGETLKKPGATAAPGGTVPAIKTPAGSKASAGTSQAFASVKAKADRVDAPILAVTIWEKFIDSNPSHADLEAAKAEKASWEKLQKDGAEKVHGKWIGGDERKKLLEKAKKMVEEAVKLEDGSMLKAVSKYEEAIKLYPNSFEPHFRLGYINLVKGGPAKQDAAIRSLEQAVKIDPQSPEALTNLAIAYSIRKQHEKAVVVAYKAVQIEDSKELVENLLACFNFAPSGMQRNNQKMRPIMDDAKVLAQKHGISGPPSGYHYLPPGYSESKRIVEGKPPVEKEGGPPGIIGNGSGFLISEDGYLMTNRHVVDSGAGHYYRVRFDDGTEKNAEIVSINEKADCALLKIKSDSPLPYLKIADANPNPAAKALVLGYPATGSDTRTMQVSGGDVASINPGDEHEVWFHLATTHGNSGGPIVDKNCRVIGILTAGRTVHNVTYVLGVGPMQIKSFLDDLGDKAPSIAYEPPGTGGMDNEELAALARKSTLLVLIVRGTSDTDGGATPGEADPGSGGATGDGGDEKPGGEGAPAAPAPGGGRGKGVTGGAGAGGGGAGGGGAAGPRG